MSVTIDPSITLAELVTQRPALARELERRRPAGVRDRDDDVDVEMAVLAVDPLGELLAHVQPGFVD